MMKPASGAPSPCESFCPFHDALSAILRRRSRRGGALALELIVSQRFELSSNFGALDPLADEHALFLYRGDRSADLGFFVVDVFLLKRCGFVAAQPI
jgi:hypothetical protein